jgi:uncharacterized protein
MKKLSKILFGLAFALLANQVVVCQKNSESPFAKIGSIQDRFEPLRFSEIKPAGWLKQQMQRDLKGFIGNLDSIVPDLIVKDDIYGKNRLTKKVKSKDVGAISDGGDWEVQFLWWNSETQSNWRDGYIRNAILTNDQFHLAQTRKYVEKILKSQDSDGYIGIYDKDLRYKFDNENGELWSKATILRGLLAWYEYTQDAKVLKAIERAVDDVMKNYPMNKSRPFYSVKPNVGGVTHGLAFTDVLENIYRITKDAKYRDYSLFLYADFSSEVLNEDAQLTKLLDENRALIGHGVHTYEHLRSLAAAYSASGNPQLKSALDKFLIKINRSTTPSGGVIGDEFIGGREADSTDTGYEYCSLQEAMNGYTDLLEKTGNVQFAENAERIFFNAAQGARNPDESCIAYLKTDNSFEMTGARNGDKSDYKQTRYKYSSAHQDAAVCCVPNAGRITPYFVKSMWMKDAVGFAATLLGASEVATEFKGKPIVIKEVTNYPYKNSFRFDVSNPLAKKFKLKVRKPAWATGVKSNSAYIENDGFLVFDVKKSVANISLNFDSDVSVRSFKNEKYVSFGALIFARKISAWETTKEKYALAGFPDRFYTATENTRFGLPENSKFAVNWNKGNPEIVTDLLNLETKALEKQTLVPMGKTILRQVTFR